MTDRERYLRDRIKILANKKARRARNLDKYLAKERAYRKANRNKINASVRKWNHDHPERVKATRTRFYNKLRIVKSGGRPRPDFCDVCKGPGTGRAGISLDHDHTLGIFRGYLCGNCNAALGMAKDSPAILRALADYLDRNALEEYTPCK